MGTIKLVGSTRFSLSAGKVKYNTPNVKSSNKKSYPKQGRCKFRMKSSTNCQFNNGSFRMFPFRNGNVAETVSNSYQKFNTERGYERIEYFADLKQNKIRNQTTKNTKSNHKKWHRNHREFYQKRDEFQFE